MISLLSFAFLCLILLNARFRFISFYFALWVTVHIILWKFKSSGIQYLFLWNLSSNIHCPVYQHDPIQRHMNIWHKRMDNSARKAISWDAIDPHSPLPTWIRSKIPSKYGIFASVSTAWTYGLLWIRSYRRLQIAFLSFFTLHD